MYKLSSQTEYEKPTIYSLTKILSATVWNSI